MTATTLSAYVNLANGMAAFLAANAPTLAFDQGFRARGKQLNQSSTLRANRIVLIPGDIAGGAGSLGPPRNVGRWRGANGAPPMYETRPLVDWDRILTLSAWGYDNGDNRSELLQAAAAEAALEWGVRAVNDIVGADVVWGAVKWTVPADNAFGLELLQTFTLRQPLFDLPADRGTPGFTLAKDPSQ